MRTSKNQYSMPASSPLALAETSWRRLLAAGEGHLCLCFVGAYSRSVANLRWLQELSTALQIADGPLYRATAWVQAAACLPRPCPFCWWRHLTQDIRKSRPRSLILARREHGSAVEALEALTLDAAGTSATVFTCTSLVDVVVPRVMGMCHDEGGPRPQRETVSHGGSNNDVLLSRLAPLDWAAQIRAATDSVAADPKGEACRAIDQEYERFPERKMRRVLSALLGDCDLSVAVEELEMELTRAVCSRCFSPRPRRRPMTEVHEEWEQWAEEGLSHQQIADRFWDRYHKRCTRDCVSKALQRLRNRSSADIGKCPQFLGQSPRPPRPLGHYNPRVDPRASTPHTRTAMTRSVSKPLAPQPTIDIANETPIGLPQAARRLPPFRAGRPVSPATVWRWVVEGVKLLDGRRVRLEALRLGGRWITSVEALARFAAAQTPRLGEEGTPAPGPAGQSRRASARAGEELVRRGC
jgi:Protein of unknown function (DUF1580)